MDVAGMEDRFASYLNSRDIELAPFLLAYIRLLLIFEDELASPDVTIILQRQKELRGEGFREEGFGELRSVIRKRIDREVESNKSVSRAAALDRLIFCAMLDSDESDVFYLTEPMFEFVRKMNVSPDQLRQVLEAEFVGLSLSS